MTRWLSEERPNSLIARSQVRISTVHHRVRAALCLLIQQRCCTDGPKFKPATICFQEPGTSASASLIQRSPWRRGHGNDKSGIALTSVKVHAGSEVVYRDTKGYHHLKNRQESDMILGAGQGLLHQNSISCSRIQHYNKTTWTRQLDFQHELWDNWNLTHS